MAISAVVAVVAMWWTIKIFDRTERAEAAVRA
jgi:hypothetical protein